MSSLKKVRGKEAKGTSTVRAFYKLALKHITAIENAYEKAQWKLEDMNEAEVELPWDLTGLDELREQVEEQLEALNAK